MKIYLILLIVSLFLLGCENKDIKKKEDELAKRELEIKEKETKQLEEKKEELTKKEAELKQQEMELKYRQKNKANSSPESIPKEFVESIDKYLKNADERHIRRAYNLWYQPSEKIGSFSKFIEGFANTIDDKIISLETISNDGYNAEVVVIHIAKELNVEMNYKIQQSKYESRYKMVSINGQWKINHGNAKLLDRFN